MRLHTTSIRQPPDGFRDPAKGTRNNANQLRFDRSGSTVPSRGASWHDQGSFRLWRPSILAISIAPKFPSTRVVGKTRYELRFL